jgi:heme A synthase
MLKHQSISTLLCSMWLAAPLWATPAWPQVADSLRQAPAGDLRSDAGITLLIAVLGGALGALAADLVTDGGRIDRWKKDENGWTLGFLGKLIVGSVAAVIMSSVNPAEMWWELAGTALGAGVGAEAVLLSIIAARKAESAEAARDQAEAHGRGIAEFADQRLEVLSSIAAEEEARIQEAALHLPAEAGVLGGGGADGRWTGASGSLAAAADRFRAEVAAFAAAGHSHHHRG